MIDLAGETFGRLFVLKRADNNKYNQACWLCECTCGEKRIVVGSDLRAGKSKSCGCYRKEIILNHTKHGQSHTPTYQIWLAMRARCRNPNSSSYDNYGGRGIKVCKRWNDFTNFFTDMGEKPKNLTIERVDNDGNYEASNCIWASRETQARNKRMPRNNTIGAIGISWNKQDKNYRVRIGANNYCYDIGRYKVLEDAIVAREKAEQKYWNKHAS